MLTLTTGTAVTLTTGTTRTLLVALGLVEQHTVRELVLTGLRIDLKQLDLDVVALLDASLLDGLQALPLDLGDVEQTFLARQDLDEAAVRHDALHHTVVDLTYLRQGHDALDLGDGGVDALLIRSRHLHVTHTVALVDGDGRACVFLHLLDNLSARANDSADELLGDVEGNDAGHLRLHLLTGLADGLHHFAHDMLTTGLGLHESLFDDVKRQTVALDIHLGSGQTVLGTGGLEVHIAQVVLVAEDIREDGILVFAGVLDQTHGNTCHRLLDRHTCIHQRQRTAADGSHRRRAVRLENV